MVQAASQCIKYCIGMPAYLLSIILFNNCPQQSGFYSVHRKETVGLTGQTPGRRCEGALACLHARGVGR